MAPQAWGGNKDSVWALETGGLLGEGKVCLSVRGGRKTSPGPCGGQARRASAPGRSPRQVESVMLYTLIFKSYCVFCGVESD